jgi:oligopeptide/dipeptide ABC transporter ATP-binding protein
MSTKPSGAEASRVAQLRSIDEILRLLGGNLRHPDIAGKARPSHPYTAGLLASTVLGAAQGTRLEAIPGAPPDMTALPPGCSFAQRCCFADTRCVRDLPPEVALASDHMVRCLRVAAGEMPLARPKVAETVR